MYLLQPVATGLPQLNTIHHCTAVQLLQALPSGCVDLAIQDPPYGIKYRSSWQTTNGNEQRTTKTDIGKDVICLDWIPENYRVLKFGGALYLFTRWDVLHIWQRALEDAGFKVVQCIIWDKMHFGAGNLDYYGSQTEFILFAVKGDHQLRWSKREGNLWTLTKMDAINNEGNYDNPTQKPERLLQRAIVRSSNPGDLVLDTFAGSGSTAAAARNLQRNYLTCDRDYEQYQIAKTRLSKPLQVAMPLMV